jgi:hypothetical protein
VCSQHGFALACHKDTALLEVEEVGTPTAEGSWSDWQS